MGMLVSKSENVVKDVNTIVGDWAMGQFLKELAPRENERWELLDILILTDSEDVDSGGWQTVYVLGRLV